MPPARCNSPRQGSACCAAKESASEERAGDADTNRGADRQGARGGAAPGSSTTAAAALRRMGTCSEHQPEGYCRPRLLCPPRRKKPATTEESKYSGSKKEGLTIACEEGRRKFHKGKTRREAAHVDSDLHTRKWTPSPVATRGQPGSQRRLEHEAKQRDFVTVVNRESSASAPSDVQASDIIKVKPCKAVAGTDRFFQGNTPQTVQTTRLYRNAESGEMVMPPASPLSCACALPPLCAGKINRPQLDSEDVWKPCAAAFSSAAALSGPDWDCWGVRSCTAGERGKTASSAAAVAAAAARCGKQAAVPPSRMSRLTRDFTDIVVVGKGGCGRVLKARHHLDGRVYAIKEIKFAATTRHLQSRMQLFLREVHCLRRLDSNENIVRYFSSWVEVSPLSKTPSSPPQEDEVAATAAAAGHNTADDEDSSALVSTRAKKEAAPTEDEARHNRAYYKGKRVHSSSASHPFQGKGKSDECLSFYSVSHSQTSGDSRCRPDDCATAGADARCASLGRGEKIGGPGVHHHGPLLSKATGEKEETGSSHRLTRTFDENRRDEGVTASAHSSGKGASCDWRWCGVKAGTIAEEPTLTPWPAAAANEDPRARHCTSRVDESEKRCSSVEKKTSGEAVYHAEAPGGPGVPAGRRFSSEDSRQEVKKRVNHGGETSMSACHSQRAAQASRRAASWGPPDMSSYSENHGKVTEQVVDTSSTLPEHFLPDGRQVDEDDACALHRLGGVNKLTEDGNIRNVSEEGSRTCDNERQEILLSYYPLCQGGQKKDSNAEIPVQKHQDSTQGGGSERGAAVVASAAGGGHQGIVGTVFPKKTKLFSAVVTPGEDDPPLKRRGSTYSGSFSYILRRAFRRGRASRSSSDRGSQGISVDAVPHGGDEKATHREKTSHSFSFFSSPGCMRKTFSRRCEREVCAEEQKNGCVFVAEGKHDYHSCEGGHSGWQTTKNCTEENPLTTASSSGLTLQNFSCASTEERFITDALPNASGQKFPESLSDAGGALGRLPSMSGGPKSQAPRRLEEAIVVDPRREGDAPDKPTHPDSDKAAFQSAVSVEDRKECGTLAAVGEQEDGNGLFLPSPRRGRDFCECPTNGDEEGLVEEGTKWVATSEHDGNSRCQSQAGATEGKDTLVMASTREDEEDAPPAFVALADFWCCDDFGPQTQSDGLEIVFAEEALPSGPVLDRPGQQAEQEGSASKRDALTEKKHVALGGAAASVLPTPTVGGGGSAGGAGAPASVGEEEQQALRQHTDTTRKTTVVEAIVPCSSSAVSQPGTEEQRHLVAAGASPVAGALPRTSATLRPRRASGGSGGSGVNEESSHTSTADAALGRGAAASACGSPVSAETAAPASAEGAAQQELFTINKRGMDSPEGCCFRLEKKLNVRNYQGGASPAGNQQGTPETESENEPREQAEHPPRREQQQTEHQHTQQQQQTEQQQHPADASRTGGIGGARVKQAGGTRVEVSLYIQMEYCPMSLDEYIAQTPEIDPERNEEIMAMIVNGLYSCHSAGVMHRDLKPSNIFIKEGGAVKLGDFGLAFSEDMDDDLWHGSRSASPAAGARCCLREDLGGSRVQTASAFPKDPNNRVSQNSLAPTPSRTPKITATIRRQRREEVGRHELPSPLAASHDCGGAKQHELHSPSGSWPQERLHALRQQHVLDQPAIQRGVLPAPRFHPAEGCRGAEGGQCGCSADEACQEDQSKSAHTKSETAAPPHNSRIERTQCEILCAQHAAGSISSPPCQQEEHSEDRAAHHPISRVRSLPVFSRTAASRAAQRKRVFSKGEVKQMAYGPCSMCCSGLTAAIFHPEAHLQHGHDVGLLGRHPRCWHWHCSVQSCPASAPCCLWGQEGNVCIQCCCSSKSTPALRPAFLDCVLALSSCGCPLDTPALLVEGNAKQQEKRGRWGRRGSVGSVLPDRATRCAAASKTAAKHDGTSSIQMQPRGPRQSDGDRNCSKQLLQRRDSCATSTACPSCDAPKTTGAHEPPHQTGPGDSSSAGPLIATRTPSAEDCPVVVVQPPLPTVWRAPAATPNLKACMPLSPHRLVPVKRVQASGAAEEGDRSSSAFCGSRRSSELRSGSGRTSLASHSGSCVSPSLSMLASPIFSNRTTGVGTSAYAPPEQLKGGQYDYSVDIWSLGLIAIDLFTRCETAMERAMNFRNAREGKLPLSIRMHFPWVVPFCQWCLQKDPSQRPTIKQLYTHQCITGSVFAPRSPLISPVPVMRLLAPEGSLSSSRGQAETPDVPVAEQKSTHVYSVMNRAEQLEGFPRLPQKGLQTDKDGCGRAAGSVHCPQFHVCCRGGGYGSYMNFTPTEYKAFFKPLSDHHGAARRGGLHLCVPHETRSRFQKREAGKALASCGRKGRIRKEHTSPSLTTMPSPPPPPTPPPPAAELKKSPSAWLSADEGESSLVAGRRGVLHAPVPLSALTLPQGVLFRGSSPIRCSSPVSAEQQTLSATITTTTTDQAAASAGACSSSQSSGEDEQRSEGPQKERSSKSCEEQPTHLRPIINTQAESEGGGSPNAEDISRQPDYTLDDETVIRATTTWRRTSDVTTDKTTLRAADLTSGGKDERAVKAGPGGSQMLDEDAGTREKETWKKFLCHRECFARNKEQTTERVGSGSASGDGFGGTGSTMDDQYASLCSVQELSERSFDANTNWCSCPHVPPRQAAENAALLTVYPSAYALADWEAQVTGLTDVTEHAKPRQQQAGESSAELGTTRLAKAYPIDSSAELVARRGPENGDSVTPFAKSCEEALFTDLEAVERARCLEGGGSWAQVKNFDDAVYALGHAVKIASDEDNTESSCSTKKKSLEDSIHSAVKKYAQGVLDRCCEASAADRCSQRDPCGSAALAVVPRPEDHARSNGVWRKSDLFELRMQCAPGETVESVGPRGEGDQRQLAQQQPQQYTGGQQEFRQPSCQTIWDTYERDVFSMPTPRGSMLLRGFLSVSSRSIGPPGGQRLPLSRAQIYMRSRRGEWKIRFAAVDKEKKLMYIFSDRNDTTKAKRIINIEGEDGYCGVLMWEENGSWTTNAEQNSAQFNFTRNIHEGHGTIINATATAERRPSGSVVQTCRTGVPPPPVAEADTSAQPCTSNIIATTCSEMAASLAHTASDDAVPSSVYLHKGEQACLFCEAAPNRASSLFGSSDSASTEVSLRSPSNEGACAVQVGQGPLGYCTTSEHECVSGGDTGRCRLRSGFRAELHRDANNFVSAHCVHSEIHTDRGQAKGSLTEEVPEKFWRNDSERQTCMQHSYQPPTRPRGTPGDEVFCCSSLTEKGGNCVQRRLELEAEHVHKGSLGEPGDPISSRLHKTGKRLSQHHNGEVSGDTVCRGVVLPKGSVEDTAIPAAGRQRARLFDRMKALCGSSTSKLQAVDAKARSTTASRRRFSTERRVDHDTDRTGACIQQSSSQKNGRWNSWLASNERTFAGWIVRGGSSLDKAEPEISRTSDARVAQNASPGGKDDMRIAVELSQCVRNIPSLGVRCACELNILLTHNSLLDDVWMRVIVGSSRSSCSTSQEDDTVGTCTTTKRDSQSTTDTTSMQGRTRELGHGDSENSAEDEDGDEAMNFVESLMTCFQCTEVMGGNSNSESRQQSNR